MDLVSSIDFYSFENDPAQKLFHKNICEFKNDSLSAREDKTETQVKNLETGYKERP